MSRFRRLRALLLIPLLGVGLLGRPRRWSWIRRPPTRQSVAPLPQDAAAKFSPARRPRNLFFLSAQGHEVIMPARGDAKETKRS